MAAPAGPSDQAEQAVTGLLRPVSRTHVEMVLVRRRAELATIWPTGERVGERAGCQKVRADDLERLNPESALHLA